jgi:glycosyltransferase involved in cell wall biosynthesis
LQPGDASNPPIWVENGGGCDQISLRVALMKRKITPSGPGIRGMSAKTLGGYLPRRDKFLLSVVIPCFNEEDVILLTYKRLVDVLGRRDFRLQIILVDDGSDDGTPEMAANLAKGDPRVKTVLLSRNFGHQAAVSAGLAHADGDAIVVMDADLQDPPEAVIQMVESWLDGADVVYGIRTKRKESLFKRTSYSVFYWAFQRLSNIDAPIDAGDFSLIDRKVLDVINELPEKNRFFVASEPGAGFVKPASSMSGTRAPPGPASIRCAN